MRMLIADQISSFSKLCLVQQDADVAGDGMAGDTRSQTLPTRSRYRAGSSGGAARHDGLDEWCMLMVYTPKALSSDSNSGLSHQSSA